MNTLSLLGLVVLILIVLLAGLFVLIFNEQEARNSVKEEFCPNYVMTHFSEYYCNGKEFVCYKDRCDYIGGDCID